MPSQESEAARARKAAHEVPEWSTLDADEVEELIIELGREGKQSAHIGTILRDQHAVPDVKAVTGKKITDILDEEDLLPPVPEDLANLMARALNLREHLRDHPKDKENKRGLQQLEANIRSLAKYYREKEALPYDWKYDERTAQMVVEGQ